MILPAMSTIEATLTAILVTLQNVLTLFYTNYCPLRHAYANNMRMMHYFFPSCFLCTFLSIMRVHLAVFHSQLRMQRKTSQLRVSLMILPSMFTIEVTWTAIWVNSQNALRMFYIENYCPQRHTYTNNMRTMHYCSLSRFVCTFLSACFKRSL